MIKRLLATFLPPLVLGVILSLVLIMPRHKELQSSAISPALPLDFELAGWYGVKQQESEQERTMLAGDTKFSKAVYSQLRQSLFDKQLPPVHASIVYSGSDMNSSIHRPERCLPSQGHVDLRAGKSKITLANGKRLTFTRLTSRVPFKDQPGKYVEYINYYIFIGRDRICAEHLERTLYDIWDRSAKGVVQRWAYYQLGTCWGDNLGVTEEEADSQLRRLISELTPGLVNWDAVGE